MAEPAYPSVSLPAGHTGQKFGPMKWKGIGTDIIYINIYIYFEGHFCKKDLIIDMLKQLSFKTSWEFPGGPVFRTLRSHC